MTRLDDAFETTPFGGRSLISNVGFAPRNAVAADSYRDVLNRILVCVSNVFLWQAWRSLGPTFVVDALGQPGMGRKGWGLKSETVELGPGIVAIALECASESWLTFPIECGRRVFDVCLWRIIAAFPARLRRCWRLQWRCRSP